MKGFATVASAAALTLAVVSFTGPAQAAVIAQFTPDTAADDYAWVQGASGMGGEFHSIGTNGPIAGCTTCTATHFSFLDPTLAALAFVPATFQIDALVAAGTPATTNGAGVFTQTGVDGNFHFTYFDHNFAVGSTQVIGGVSLTNGVTNLLSGVFTGAWIQGAGGSGSTNLALANGGHAAYASDVLDFGHIVTSSEEFALNLLQVSPSFGAGAGKSLDSFHANGGGNFSADLIGVPETATWALMLVGFGGLGAVLRRRPNLALASA